MVSLPSIKTDLRQELDIPSSALVIGRHGGTDTFNITFVKELIVEMLENRTNIYFLFMPCPDMLADIVHPRFICLNVTTDNVRKRKFINTCDIGIHASILGESFGLSILEFSFCNKPMLIWKGGMFNNVVNQQHLTFMKDVGLFYKSKEELKQYIESKFSESKSNWIADCLKNGRLGPSRIMTDFSSLIDDAVQNRGKPKIVNKLNKLNVEPHKEREDILNCYLRLKC
jgi:hypothetical protein